MDAFYRGQPTNLTLDHDADARGTGMSSFALHAGELKMNKYINTAYRHTCSASKDVSAL